MARELPVIRPHALPMTDARARLLRAAVGFCLVPATEPELRLLHRWMDSWRGVGDVVTGMNRQGLSLLKSSPARLICIRRTDSLFCRTWSDGSGSVVGQCEALFAPVGRWRWRPSPFGSSWLCGRGASRGRG